MKFLSETVTDGIVERDFVVDGVPGVLWSPESGSDHAPLVLMGHPGGMHTKAPGLLGRAHGSVRTYGFTVASINAPGHGGRPRTDADQRLVDAMLTARRAGEPAGPIFTEYMESVAVRAVPEWRATLDALQALPEIGDVPVGYAGMTLGTAIGLPLVAAEPRIKAAILGGVLASRTNLETAARVTIPVEYLLPWDDDELDRESGIAMFDALASKEKTLIAFQGNHAHVPGHQIDTRFLARHLLT